MTLYQTETPISKVHHFLKILRELIVANHQFWKISWESIFLNQHYRRSDRNLILLIKPNFAKFAKISSRENFFPQGSPNQTNNPEQKNT